MTYAYVDDTGAPRTELRSTRRTVRCDDGRACAWDSDPITRAFVPDGVATCDSCLLMRYEANETFYDSDDWMMLNPLVPRDVVAAALRRALAPSTRQERS